MNESNPQCPVVLQSGFRVFFLGAGVYAVLSILIWLFFYVAQWNIFVAMPLTVWHGHEMIFGFTMAVIAGFLLTAVTNWTGLATISGLPLLWLFLIWTAARVLAFMPASFPLWPLAICNLVFTVFLAVAVIRPIVAVKQWKQSAVLSKLFLIFMSESVFYWALAHADLEWERKALKFSVYMVISLILTVARRIMPFFVERGVGYPVVLRNSKFLDWSSVVLLIAVSIVDVFFVMPGVVFILSIVLVAVHGLRLAGWYTSGIFKKPLLWVLFAGYFFIICGFLLKAFSVLNHRFDDSAMHAFTAGGIGIFILGMMARVSLGHTGRNVDNTSGMLVAMFSVLVSAVIFRVFFTLALEHQYVVWIGMSQVLWMISFVLYLIMYIPILMTKRMDGKVG